MHVSCSNRTWLPVNVGTSKILTCMHHHGLASFACKSKFSPKKSQTDCIHKFCWQGWESAKKMAQKSNKLVHSQSVSHHSHPYTCQSVMYHKFQFTTAGWSQVLVKEGEEEAHVPYVPLSGSFVDKPIPSIHPSIICLSSVHLSIHPVLSLLKFSAVNVPLPPVLLLEQLDLPNHLPEHLSMRRQYRSGPIQDTGWIIGHAKECTSQPLTPTLRSDWLSSEEHFHCCLPWNWTSKSNSRSWTKQTSFHPMQSQTQSTNKVRPDESACCTYTVPRCSKLCRVSSYSNVTTCYKLTSSSCCKACQKQSMTSESYEIGACTSLVYVKHPLD